MSARPATPFGTRLRLTAVEAGASAGETALAAAAGAALTLYGGALVHSGPDPVRMAAAAIFTAACVLLARLSGDGVAAALARGLLRDRERAFACGCLALAIGLALAGVDPALMAFAGALLFALRAPNPVRGALAIGLVACGAIAAGLVGRAVDPTPFALGLWFAASAAIALPLALGLDARSLPARAPALAAALALSAPLLCIAALAREAPTGAPIAVAGFAFVGSVQAAATALGRASPRHAALAVRAYAFAGALALGTTALAPAPLA